VISRRGVGDHHSRVHADQGEPLVTECLHHGDQVVTQGAGVVPILGLVREADAALVDSDDLEVVRERRHHESPVEPGLGPAVDQQQGRPLAADHGMQAQLVRVDVMAGERVGEPLRDLWHSGDGAWAFRGGQVACSFHRNPLSREPTGS
jgi:hypothetical protein